MYRIRLIILFYTIVIYIYFCILRPNVLYTENSKKTKEESIKVDRKNDGTQKDISVDSVW